jgi:hypothetical protein
MGTALAGGRGAQLVLAGDPKQLGPIVRSPLAQRCGAHRAAPRTQHVRARTHTQVHTCTRIHVYRQ